MERVRVLQGCSINEKGCWFHQGAVLEVEDPDAHYRTVTDKDGRNSRLPCVEPVEDDVPLTVSPDLFPNPRKAGEE